MFETYRMLGKQREAELFREARRLQVGVATRPGAPCNGLAANPGNDRPEVERPSLLWRLVANLGATRSDVEDERGTRQQRARTGR